MVSKRDKDFNQDIIDCIDFLLKELHNKKSFWLDVSILQKKWGEKRGYELETFLSYKDAIFRKGNKIRIHPPNGINLKEEARLKIFQENFFLKQLETQIRHHKSMLQVQNKFNKENLVKQEESIKWTRILAVATIFLALFTMWMAQSMKNSLDAEIELYKPKIVAQITNEELLWSHYAPEYEHKVWQIFWSSISYKVPIYVEINNNGLVPFQLYNIEFKSSCGDGNRGLLSFPENFSKNIGVGESSEFTTGLIFSGKPTIQDALPCEINFTIYGNNLVEKKRMKIIKDTIN